MDFRWPPPPDGHPDGSRHPYTRGPRLGRPTLPQLPTELVSTPHGVELERLSVGSGTPTTVFAHGLGYSITDTRSLGSTVNGTKVFFHFRGHGQSASPPGSWTYGDFARDCRAIADLTGATQAVGVSAGASVLCRLLADNPSRFDRVVLLLPSPIDHPWTSSPDVRLSGLVEAVQSGDAATIAEMISQEIPSSMRYTPASWEYLRQRLEQLMRDGLGKELACLPQRIVLNDYEVLRSVTTSVLIIGCLGDDTHPAATAERLAEVIPDAKVHMYDRPGVVWTWRADLRRRISSFLNI